MKLLQVQICKDLEHKIEQLSTQNLDLNNKNEILQKKVEERDHELFKSIHQSQVVEEKKE